MTPEKLPLRVAITSNDGKPLLNRFYHHPALKDMTRREKRKILRSLKKQNADKPA